MIKISDFISDIRKQVLCIGIETVEQYRIFIILQIPWPSGSLLTYKF